MHLFYRRFLASEADCVAGNPSANILKGAFPGALLC